jgi:hypothetical protein
VVRLYGIEVSSQGTLLAGRQMRVCVAVLLMPTQQVAQSLNVEIDSAGSRWFACSPESAPAQLNGLCLHTPRCLFWLQLCLIVGLPHPTSCAFVE